MTTRKPKLNLLYVTDASMPWLQLAVVTAEANPSQQHARQWQTGRVVHHAAYAVPARTLTPRKH